MAIIREFERANGAIGEYWKITGVSLTGLIVTWTLELFVDRARASEFLSLGEVLYKSGTLAAHERCGNLIAAGYRAFLETQIVDGEAQIIEPSLRGGVSDE